MRKKEIDGVWKALEDTRKMIHRLAEVVGYEFYDKYYYPDNQVDKYLIRKKGKKEKMYVEVDK